MFGVHQKAMENPQKCERLAQTHYIKNIILTVRHGGSSIMLWASSDRVGKCNNSRNDEKYRYVFYRNFSSLSENSDWVGNSPFRMTMTLSILLKQHFSGLSVKAQT